MPELKLKNGDVIRLEGQLSLEVKEGEVLVSGGLRKKGDKFIIPRAKSVPLEVKNSAIVNYTLGQDGKIERLSARTIPHEWDALVSEIIQKRPKIVLIMGSVDVGKTFFTTYLGNMLLKNGIRTGAIDSDSGQADIGPPTTMGLGIFEEPVVMLYEVPLSYSYFVGSMSPSGHMMEFVVGMKWLVEHALKKADIAIVNTPGWVFGGPGRALQLYTVELIDPDFVVALQRKGELEHLLASISPSKIRRLSVSTKVRSRSPDERASLRAMLLGKYFEGAERLVLDVQKLRFERCYFKTGKPLDVRTLGIEAQTQILHAEAMPEGLLVVVRRGLSRSVKSQLEAKFEHVNVITKGSEKNVVVGLANDADELLGIGIIERIDYERDQMIVIAPVKDVSNIAVVQFGSMKIKPDGKEIGTVRPGTF